MDIIKTDYFNTLYSIYKDLLTDKQRDVFELYFLDNLSLAEIADDQHISRQAVKCCLDSATQSLTHYEKSLHFGDKMAKIEQIIANPPTNALDQIAHILHLADQNSTQE